MFRNPTTDLIVVLVIVLLIFGPKRLPGLGKQLGTGLREFKESITGESKHEDEDEDARPEITAASASTPQAAPTPAPAERESAEVGPQSRS
ncbi:MAG TPA: twin-arginine translocase TatA/TatE family subunit [Candidatus Dormibacteraeota bacterium]|jgi:sec-independent protein translocase protein TatA